MPVKERLLDVGDNKDCVLYIGYLVATSHRALGHEYAMVVFANCCMGSQFCTHNSNIARMTYN